MKFLGKTGIEEIHIHIHLYIYNTDFMNSMIILYTDTGYKIKDIAK